MPQALFVPVSGPVEVLTLDAARFPYEMARKLSSAMLPIAVGEAVAWQAYAMYLPLPVNPRVSEWAGTEVYGAALLTGRETTTELFDVPTHVLVAFGVE